MINFILGLAVASYLFIGLANVLRFMLSSPVTNIGSDNDLLEVVEHWLLWPFTWRS